MKTRLLIIIAMISAIMISVTITYLSYQMTACQMDPAFHNTKMNGVWNCLEYLANPDPNAPDLKPSIDYDARFIDIAIIEIILIASVTSCILVFVSRRKRK